MYTPKKYNNNNNNNNNNIKIELFRHRNRVRHIHPTGIYNDGRDG